MASFRIEWKQSAVKELEKLPKPAVLRIISAIQQLSEMPYPQGTRKPAGASHTYRIRVGNYRVGYDIFESTLVVQIIRVSHRKDAYR